MGTPWEAGYRDSRGLARALSGDRAGALEDFRVVIASSTIEPEVREQRRGWIPILEANGDPFRPEELGELWAQ